MSPISFAERLPLGMRRPLFSRLRTDKSPARSWVLVGSVRREPQGLVVEFPGELVACQPLWDALLHGQPTGEPVARVAFGIHVGDRIELVAEGPVNERILWQAARARSSWREERRIRWR